MYNILAEDPTSVPRVLALVWQVTTACKASFSGPLLATVDSSLEST